MSLSFKSAFSLCNRRTLTSFSGFSPLRNSMATGSICRTNLMLGASPEPAVPSFLGSVLGLTQRRWKSRGNTFQPSTLKRKRRVGFLARAKSKIGSKILKRRKEKGRWYLTH
ncbi:LAMI_0H15676g1_1 [Lachancea mirantina]|uniref:Large ribosomal subunit protein bL34m n=1 Tax=Lachancea mirantina TaxID=1230905 RepID=A0A1G4KIV5_9SACH|nr:LAMI_0H15676g1_1 [Lachancea mirantina]